ncbi:spermatogenesis-associated protein 7-like [Saccoglossus kowalevskii]|uniref:Spermatogenesis-associated protein 7-like n=1 Tax=Saccoglossus kowalevskii TaxID=10224 RepID=A0ABM0GX90_SACKO|nr:PREDICTED: spermatogenesis-associated protein 7-like [Saccoglossus kowalevskii]
MVGGIDMQGTSRGAPSTVYDGLKGPVKGHVALKSSALAPTTTRLSNQHLIQDHLSAHYRRVSSAKAAVDTKPPKSMAISTKVRDQKRRDLGRESRISSRASSSASYRDYTRPKTDRYENYDINLSYDNFNMVNDIVEDTRHSPSTYRTPRPMKSNIPPEWQQHTKTGIKTKKWDQKDLLDTQADRFTEPEKPYTPRTLKREAQSKIAQSKNYNPPKRKSEKSDSKGKDLLSTRNTYADYNGEMESSLQFPRRLNSARVKEEEEELKYLEFVSDVTNDVLNRGIYSNRVLKQIFDKHVERKRGQLDERRMLRLMDQLRQDLGIPIHED